MRSVCVRVAYCIALAGVSSAASAQLPPPPRSIEGRLLAEHNRARAAVGVPPLQWDWRLARSAAAYGPTLSRLGRLVHAPRAGRESERENLLIGQRGYRSPEQMVQMWTSERRYFRPGIYPNVSTTGSWYHVSHYTQVVWRDTTRVGCAIYTDRRWDFLICRYAPPGNRDGRRVF